MKKKKINNGTQQLSGIKSFSRNGLLTTHGELVFFIASPTNISVLSQDSVTVKVRHLIQLLSAQPDIEIVCLDDCECFESNKDFLTQRINEETNPKIRAILDSDRKFLDEIQIAMSTARQFMFVYRLRNETDEQSFANLNRIEKAISEQGFEVKRAGKSDIKRFLSIYFGYKLVDEELPDTDGEKSAAKWVIPD
ncbi:MAG: hypothetical protein PHD46_06120 [Eubacteriales bacterium]|nr:hypothetical protein [Eubacteriales bacterium]MDD4422593.1 hypothetical protein [Eubacteriales bacterium]